jgi:hypothetical protein
MYAAETWHLNIQQEKKIPAFENNYLWRILNIHWSESVSNNTIQKIIDQPLITDTIRSYRWRYLGHVLRMENHQILKTTLEWHPVGSRKQGRPQNTLRQPTTVTYAT